ncbi:hypothetical protein BDY19DRAFT_758988 [Irpex rosettiformis]|uniref:Uncharacterized protein n=1 Tax=Irpex rosettiformis TaxID=378272 RepID=A0ACB8U759_9APHY|nr:hypothetical protein BDY19DRAFT_758988 [Irpex rosettiformis]
MRVAVVNSPFSPRHVSLYFPRSASRSIICGVISKCRAWSRRSLVTQYLLSTGRQNIRRRANHGEVVTILVGLAHTLARACITVVIERGTTVATQGQNFITGTSLIGRGRLRHGARLRVGESKFGTNVGLTWPQPVNEVITPWAAGWDRIIAR